MILLSSKPPISWGLLNEIPFVPFNPFSYFSNPPNLDPEWVSTGNYILDCVRSHMY